MAKHIVNLAGLRSVRAVNRAPARLGHGSFRVNAADDAADIYIYGDIGGWWGGIEPQEIAEEIAALDVATLNVHVNSPGGVVFDGIAIYNAFASHDANIVMHVEGIAASIASVIVMAGDEIRVGESANIMIHKPWSFMIGDADEMRAEADVLDGLEQGIVDIYRARTENDADALKVWMKAETWFRGQQAVDDGFADSVTPNKTKEKKAARSALLDIYQNTPSDLRTAPDLPEVRQFEHLLRDAEQMPSNLAKRVAAAAARVFKSARDEREVAPRDEVDSAAVAELTRRFERAAHLFKS
ncbi:Clp protease ClpP [Ancylobacter sp. MQZ15Z-1]|uniref:ATP-dependent Clp protease proteolytic subunit n=1 Tax=Ancylobacter mangrovi TaxID=2972472 RepID=A0A9X2T456_9HYPH|nr:head maturation protease, ClpP-related [Ancylobacter mangrovi]MCS0497872.1 Clp protease ClpP [Ancylobacter mangrovi]